MSQVKSNRGRKEKGITEEQYEEGPETEKAWKHSKREGQELS